MRTSSCQRIWGICAGLALVIAISSPGSARADDIGAAKALHRKAEREYAANDYAGALRLYLRAYQHAPLPGFLFNIAQCYRNLGRYDKAVEHFETYLRRSRNPSNKRTAKELLAECRKKLAGQGSAGGDPLGRASAAPLGAALGADQGRAAATREGLADDESPPRTTGRPGRQDALARLSPLYFWSGVALTGALALTATITGALTIKYGNDFDDPATPPQDLRGIKSTGESLRTAANVTFALTLVSAAAATGLFFFTDFAGKEGKTAVAAAPSPEGGMLLVTGRF